ncbi:MAG: 50S ribosomal protein L35ae [Candidatus Woesearchaeota archaeon]
MEGTIVNFRRGRHNQTENQVIVSIDGVNSKDDAEKLVGKTTKFVTSGNEKKEISGKVASAHGNKGAVRVLFERGLPGQAIGTKIVFA